MLDLRWVVLENYHPYASSLVAAAFDTLAAALRYAAERALVSELTGGGFGYTVAEYRR